MLVPSESYDEAVALAAKAAERYTPGDPFADDTKLGPLVSRAQLDRVRGYIDSGVAEGARLVTGGTDTMLGRGLLRPADRVRRRDAGHDHRARGDLRTGPVRSSPTPPRTRRVRIANDTPYGLAAAVWSARPGPRCRGRAAAARPARSRSTVAASTRSRRSAGTSSPASAASWAATAWRSSWRRSRCSCDGSPAAPAWPYLTDFAPCASISVPTTRATSSSSISPAGCPPTATRRSTAARRPTTPRTTTRRSSCSRRRARSPTRARWASSSAARATARPSPRTRSPASVRHWCGASDTARLAREHNDANVISIGARMHEADEAARFVELFLATPFSGVDRHVAPHRDAHGVRADRNAPRLPALSLCSGRVRGRAFGEAALFGPADIRGSLRRAAVPVSGASVPRPADGSRETSRARIAASTVTRIPWPIGDLRDLCGSGDLPGTTGMKTRTSPSQACGGC